MKKIIIIFIFFLFLASSKEALAQASVSFDTAEGYVPGFSISGTDGWVLGSGYDGFIVDAQIQLQQEGFVLQNSASLSGIIIRPVDVVSSESVQYFTMGMTGLDHETDYCEVDLMDTTASTELAIRIGQNKIQYSTDGSTWFDVIPLSMYWDFRLVYFEVYYNKGDQIARIRAKNLETWTEDIQFDIGGVEDYAYIGLFRPNSSTSTICYWDDFSGEALDNMEAETEEMSLFETYMGSKIPFVYFYQIQDIFDEIASTTASTSYGLSNLTAVIPASQMGGDEDITIHIASSGYITNMMGSNLLTFMDLMRGAIYLGFIFYFYYRLKGIL